MSGSFLYSDVLEAARQACAKVYADIKTPMFDPEARFVVSTSGGRTAAMGRDEMHLFHRSKQPAPVFHLALPSLPLTTRMTKFDVDRITGFWFHEDCHAMYMDYTAWKKAVAEKLSDIVNGLEDVRIEGKGMKAVPGMRPYLQALLSGITRENVRDGYNPLDKRSIVFTLALYGRIVVNGFNIPDAPALPAGAFSTWLGVVFDKLRLCKNTHDVLELARWIAANPAPLTQGAKGQGAKGQGAKGQSAEGQGSEGQGSEGQGSEGQGSEGQGSEGQGSEGQNAKAERGGNGASGEWNVTDGNVDPIQPDLSDLVKDVERRTKTTVSGNPNKGDLYNSLYQPATHVVPGSEVAPQNAQLAYAERLIPKSAKLQNHITRMVRSPERVGRKVNLTVGRLDRRALGRAYSGASNVFSKRMEIPGREAAVCLLLDLSSSMVSENRAANAAAMALAFGDALSRASVPFEVIGFTRHVMSGTPADRERHTYDLVAENTVTGTGRMQAGLIVMKSMRDAWASRRASTAYSTMRSAGGTFLAPAIRDVATRLLNVKAATRRIVFALTDGDDGYPVEAGRRACELVAEQGVEVVGVGLGSQVNVTGKFPVCINVRDPAALAITGMETLCRTLEAGPVLGPFRWPPLPTP